MLLKTPNLLKQDGFQILRHIISKTTLLELQTNALKFEGTPAVLRKDVFQTCTATQAIFKEIETYFSSEGFPCLMTNYCFYLSKSEEENWPLQFHQDTNLPNYLNLEATQQEQWLQDGFWVRINLDANDQHTGALKVVPKSHLKGKHSSFAKEEAIFLDVKESDVVLFSPLLYHGSDRMQRASTRRVFQCFFLKK
jgi:ectoine hydroxylase-related dioxygenase (phytanoyl-CoA dioxygenase family)